MAQDLKRTSRLFSLICTVLGIFHLAQAMDHVALESTQVNDPFALKEEDSVNVDTRGQLENTLQRQREAFRMDQASSDLALRLSLISSFLRSLISRAETYSTLEDVASTHFPNLFLNPSYIIRKLQLFDETLNAQLSELFHLSLSDEEKRTGSEKDLNDLSIKELAAKYAEAVCCERKISKK